MGTIFAKSSITALRLPIVHVLYSNSQFYFLFCFQNFNLLIPKMFSELHQVWVCQISKFLSIEKCNIFPLYNTWYHVPSCHQPSANFARKWCKLMKIWCLFFLMYVILAHVNKFKCVMKKTMLDREGSEQSGVQLVWNVDCSWKVTWMNFIWHIYFVTWFLYCWTYRFVISKVW